MLSLTTESEKEIPISQRNHTTGHGHPATRHYHCQETTFGDVAQLQGTHLACARPWAGTGGGYTLSTRPLVQNEALAQKIEPRRDTEVIKSAQQSNVHFISNEGWVSKSRFINSSDVPAVQTLFCRCAYNMFTS